jgi:hypothetical protein
VILICSSNPLFPATVFVSADLALAGVQLRPLGSACRVFSPPPLTSFHLNTNSGFCYVVSVTNCCWPISISVFHFVLFLFYVTFSCYLLLPSRRYLRSMTMLRKLTCVLRAITCFDCYDIFSLTYMMLSIRLFHDNNSLTRLCSVPLDSIH